MQSSSRSGRGVSKRALFIGTAMATTLLAGGAFAQAPAAPAQEEGLEQVVVTAQRVEQRLQDVPMSVQAITQKQLQLQGITSGEQLTAMVPNLVVGSESSNGIDTTVSIRGIPEVGLYVDGIWQPDIGFREGGIVEMDRVEILRGPQGTLFGRNTNGGAINYVTTKPRDEFSVHGGVELGDYNHHFANVSMDIPITSTLTSKWTVAIQDQGGWSKSLLNGQWYGGNKNSVYRGDLLWKPNSDFTLRFTGSEDDLVATPVIEERWQNIQTVGSKGANISNINAYNIAAMNPSYGPYTFNTTGTEWLNRFAGEGNSWTAQNTSWQYPGGQVGKWDNIETEPLNSEQEYTSNYTLTGTWNITPHLRFTNLAAYIRQFSYHFDQGNAAPFQQFAQLRLYLYRYWSEEAHLEGDLFDGKLNFLGGFYYLKTRQQTRTFAWGYNEFYTDPNNDAVLTGGDQPILDQTLINFIHAWGTANLNTAIGKTIDPMTGKTYAQDMQTWKPNFANTGMQQTSAADLTDTIADNVNNDYSLFGNVTAHPIKQVDIQGGLRLAWNNGTNNLDVPVGAFRTYLMPGQGGGTGYGPGSMFGYSSVTQSTNPYPGGHILTPMVTGTYHFNDDANIFFRFAKGYTTATTTFNTALNANIYLAPEEVYDYELGLRSDWFDRKLRFNLTGYYMLWGGKQVSTSIATPGGAGFAVVTTSGGEARMDGFESELIAAPVKGLQLEFSLANLNTRWLNSGTLGYPPNLGFSLSPKWTYHLSGQYQYDLPNGADLIFRADYGHQSHYQRDSDPGRQLLVPEPGYGILNGRIQYSAKGGHWNVQLYGTNLTDSAYADAGTGAPYLFGNDVTYIGQRRMYGVRLNFEY